MYKDGFTLQSGLSPSLRGSGLKCFMCAPYEINLPSPSLRGSGLKYPNSLKNWKPSSLPLYEGVD